MLGETAPKPSPPKNKSASRLYRVFLFQPPWYLEGAMGVLCWRSMNSQERSMCFAARESPNFFASFVLGFKQGNVHRRLQSHLTNNINCYIEEHRGVGKTSQLSLRCAYEIGRRHDVRIKYIQQNKDEAIRTSRLIRDIIDSPAYNLVFPEVEPDRDNWSGGSFKVKTQKYRRDATVQAEGIFGRASGRADILIADDICDLKNAIQFASLREQVKEFWNTNWLPMRELSGDIPPRTWKTGTCYHADDITADWRRYHTKHGGLLREPVLGMRSPWWEEVTSQTLIDIREEIGPLAFARSYELIPITSDLIIFPQEWIRDSMYRTIPTWEAANGIMIASIDFAFSEKKIKGDPDWSVCIIAWKDRHGGIWLKDIIRVRATFPEFKRQAIKAMVAAGVVQAVAEGNGPQKGLVQQMQEDSPVPIRRLDRTTDKVVRASERQGYVEVGKLHFPVGPDGLVRSDFQVVFDEMTTFPVGGHDDTVDGIIDLIGLSTKFPPPLKTTRTENRKKSPHSIYTRKRSRAA